MIQNNVFNASRIGTVVVCALTPNLRRADAPGNVLPQEDEEANLPRASVVNVSQILTVHQTTLVERIGALSARRLREILEGVWLVVEPREVEE